ncbi:MAG: alpha/beta hydrolase, partial [Acidobacteriota bacterium]
MKVWLVVAAALLLLAPGKSTAQSQDAALDESCRMSGKAVDEAGFVTIGGIQQWVVIEGQD